MSDFPDASGPTHVSPEMATMLGDLQKKNSLATVGSPGSGSGLKSTVLFGNGLSSHKNMMQASSSSSIKETSSSSSQQVSKRNLECKEEPVEPSMNHETLSEKRVLQVSNASVGSLKLHFCFVYGRLLARWQI